MTSISKCVYIDKLDDIVCKYDNTYPVTNLLMWKSTNIEISKEINDEDPKFKIDNIVRISKYKKTFPKGYVPDWSEETFVNKKIKNDVPWTYVISDLNPYYGKSSNSIKFLIFCLS